MIRHVLYAVNGDESVTPIGIYAELEGEQTLADTAYAGIVLAFISLKMENGKNTAVRVMPYDGLLSLPVARRGELLQHASDLARIITAPASQNAMRGNKESEGKGEKA